ncbi:MAG: methyltransferase domain-containing protein [Puia sp.]|nr:methyltransferase domain-containing protein [Puia sp.]
MSIPDEWFREWFDSPYYHTLYFERNEQEAASFIDRLIKYLDPPAGARAVDVACGKGRHARILAEKGLDVTGIDIAANSINYAQQFEHEHLHFYLHDMRQSFSINYFDYAFNFFTSFGYFRTEREHYNVIRTISHALKSQGILVLDYLNSHYAENHLVHRSEKKIDGITYYLTKWYDETHFYKKIVIEDDRLAEPLEYMEKVAKFSPGDFNDMFSYHGLQIQEIFGDYNLGPYDINLSPRLLLVAKKTEK